MEDCPCQGINEHDKYFADQSNQDTLVPCKAGILLLGKMVLCLFRTQKLEVVDMPTLRSALAEVLPNATALITDVFGNYVMQKFLEHGNHEVRERIAAVLKGQVSGVS